MISPEQYAEDVIRNAEQATARIFEVPGKIVNSPISKDLIHSILVDENYMAVASHVDTTTKEKIKQGLYVDFAKLVPRDRVIA